MESDNFEGKRQSLKNLFTGLFKKSSYYQNDYFDFNIWFVKRKDKNCVNPNYFRELLSQTPTENDDIIKFILIKSFIKTRNNSYKIKVEDFIDEVVENLIKLNSENKRLDSLIKSYDAYKTKNLIEQNLNNFEKFLKNQEYLKSTIKVSLNEIVGIPRGDYKMSLMASFISTNITFIDDYENNSSKEEILEFKLNQLVKIKEGYNYMRNENIGEYFFSKIDFYSYEIKNTIIKYDSGTNLLYFFIRVENLNKNDEVVYTEKKSLIDIFLANIQNLLNCYNRNKLLVVELPVKSLNYDYKVKLSLNIEFDPWTLASIYNKIVELLQGMISYKVLVDHKYKTITNYFEEIEGDIDEILSDQANEKKSECLIF
jgi:hypothetical protein